MGKNSIFPKGHKSWKLIDLWKNSTINASFSSFLMVVFLVYPIISPGLENTIFVQKWICWNISFFDSHIEEMPKTGNIEIPRICHSLHQKKAQFFHLVFNRKPSTSTRLCHLKMLAFVLCVRILIYRFFSEKVLLFFENLDYQIFYFFWITWSYFLDFVNLLRSQSIAFI